MSISLSSKKIRDNDRVDLGFTPTRTIYSIAHSFFASQRKRSKDKPSRFRLYAYYGNPTRFTLVLVKDYPLDSSSLLCIAKEKD